jgi:3-dehydroquinate dehydratase I
VDENTKKPLGARIIGIVTASNRNDPEMWRALAESDIAEFRADLWESTQVVAELKAFRQECIDRFGAPIETIFTIRLKRDGGAWPDEDSLARENLWLALGIDGLVLPCEWLDLELETMPMLSPKMLALLDRHRVKILVSHHNMRHSYSTTRLADLGQELLKSKPEGIKLAVTCHSREEVLVLLAFTQSTAGLNSHACVLSMGSLGQATRVLGPLLGCPMTYGYLSGTSIAPGQLSVYQMRKFLMDSETNMPKGRSNAEILDWAEARLAGESFAN